MEQPINGRSSGSGLDERGAFDAKTHPPRSPASTKRAPAPQGTQNVEPDTDFTDVFDQRDQLSKRNSDDEEAEVGNSASEKRDPKRKKKKGKKKGKKRTGQEISRDHADTGSSNEKRQSDGSDSSGGNAANNTDAANANAGNAANNTGAANATAAALNQIMQVLQNASAAQQNVGPAQQNSSTATGS